MRTKIASETCFQLARFFAKLTKSDDSGQNPNAYDRTAYQNWRKSSLKSQFDTHFEIESVKGKDVIDFGCGGAELCFYLANEGVRSICGIEMNEKQLELARRQASTLHLPVQPTFQLSEDPKRIDKPDNCYDVVLCFDVLEHILDYKSIFSEWFRVLRDGGIILIWWIPYYHPYGHHVQSLVPVPWAHVFFSDASIIAACAKIYDMPDFEPRVWDMDENGEKKPNKWLELTELPTLNKLSIAGFEAIAESVGFEFQRREFHPISKSGLVNKISRLMTKNSYLREYFTSPVIYELRKPDQSGNKSGY